MPVTSFENEFFDLVTSGPYFGAIPKYKILIEGDSWVSHPLLSNLSLQIDDLGNDDFAILNLALPGDTAKRMFDRRSRQLKRMGQLIHDKRFGYEFDMLMISAAGNDIVGSEIVDFVDKYNTNGRKGSQLVNQNFDAMMKQVVKNYENLIKLRNRTKINKKTPIVCHCYSYLKPRKVGTKLFGAMFGKGWVKQYLDKLDIPQSDQQEIIIEMLDRFYHSIKALEQKYDNFIMVDTRKALWRNNKPRVSMFHDEIHPKGKGFKKVAKIIRTESKRHGMWPE
jgi:uncharacterized protein YsxB (DUF464 family)